MATTPNPMSQAEAYRKYVAREITYGEYKAVLDDAKMGLQNQEFSCVEALAEAYRKLQATPIVDDDYPEMRFKYENAVRYAIDAFRCNGRPW